MSQTPTRIFCISNRNLFFQFYIESNSPRRDTNNFLFIQILIILSVSVTHASDITQAKKSNLQKTRILSGKM